MNNPSPQRRHRRRNDVATINRSGGPHDEKRVEAELPLPLESRCHGARIVIDDGGFGKRASERLQPFPNADDGLVQNAGLVPGNCV